MKSIFLTLLLFTYSFLFSGCKVEDFYDADSNWLDRQMFDSSDHKSYFDYENVKKRREYEKTPNVYF